MDTKEFYIHFNNDRNVTDYLDSLSYEDLKDLLQEFVENPPVGPHYLGVINYIQNKILIMTAEKIEAMERRRAYYER